MGKIPYKVIVGSIMYAVIAIKLDIMALVGIVNEFMQNLGHAHWKTMKQIMIFSYIKFLYIYAN
jgi:hypothetical protein